MVKMSSRSLLNYINSIRMAKEKTKDQTIDFSDCITIIYLYLHEQPETVKKCMKQAH